MPRRVSDATLMKRFREQFELSQQEVAELLRMTQGNVGHIENARGGQGLRPLDRELIERMMAVGSLDQPIFP